MSKCLLRMSFDITCYRLLRAVPPSSQLPFTRGYRRAPAAYQKASALPVCRMTPTQVPLDHRWRAYYQQVACRRFCIEAGRAAARSVTHWRHDVGLSISAR